MTAVRESVEKSLREICGEDRVRTDRVERKMYSFDIGAMPSLVKPFVPAGVAGAVVRPQSEEQLVRLVGLAQFANSRLAKRVTRHSQRERDHHQWRAARTRDLALLKALDSPATAGQARSR